MSTMRRRDDNRARLSKLSAACYLGILYLLYRTGCNCHTRFPNDLVDDWTATGSKVFQFSPRSLRGYKVCPASAEETCDGYPDEWTVVFNQSYKYVIRSNVFLSDDSNVEQNLYTCLYLLKLADGMYLAYQGPTGK
ncbi:hypothetical protein Btru_075202 [Bulinus truncatus]|nr:hypothetical protein Btru_075202 [Bulinus truncatus]